MNIATLWDAYNMTALVGSIDQGTSSTRWILTAFSNSSLSNIQFVHQKHQVYGDLKLYTGHHPIHFHFSLKYINHRFMVFEAGSGEVIGQHQQEVKQLFPHERSCHCHPSFLFEIHSREVLPLFYLRFITLCSWTYNVLAGWNKTPWNSLNQLRFASR